MDVWSWICELPNSEEFSLSNSLVFPLTTDSSVQIKAEKSFGSNLPDPISVTFSVCSSTSTLWISNTCNLYSDEKPFLPLILQLLQEIIARSPNAHESTCPRSQLQKLNSDPVTWILDSHSTESFSSFFNLIFLTRLFWICVMDAPSEIGTLYFNSIFAPNLGIFSCKNSPVLRNFFISVGTDVEICFVRTFGYMIAKWLILREVSGAGLKSITPPPLPSDKGFSYATESHGLWILKGYTPIKATNCLWSDDGRKNQFPVVEAKESVLKYALAHQQLEAIIQMEYTVGFNDGYIQIHARVDNIRLHVVKLGFRNKDDEDFLDEKYFPSRVRVWVGPEIGANYLSGLSLGRSTDNMEKEVEVQKVFKGDFGNSKTPEVKATARMTTKTKIKNWRWDQDVEGNSAIFDVVLCDNSTGIEISTWKPAIGGAGPSLANDIVKRYNGARRVFTKNGGVIFSDEECKNGVRWRLNKEMEGSVLRWRIGGQVWLTYWPNDIKSSYNETRCVEWCDEVDLPLIPPK
ncbi:hypothetical protein M9H77_20478 [Catharanthus roseus]|uniref:Uncharacterized protein n=1 Tax=Catharanthus roseus TaxID=4058 RepID=A0ACC0ALA0_CATRO|nr:hypothetical protein M9H77_20478 [Catharanthus roseus]